MLLEVMDAIPCVQSHSEQFPFMLWSSFQSQKPFMYNTELGDTGPEVSSAPSIPSDWSSFHDHSSFVRVAASGTLLFGKITIELEEVRSPGVIYRLSDPIQVEVSFENGLWVYEAKAFSILAFGSTEAEALCSFYEDFAVLWEEIGQSSDENLTADALSVKRALGETIEAIEPVQ
jgi:hypothetical protein